MTTAQQQLLFDGPGFESSRAYHLQTTAYALHTHFEKVFPVKPG
jgi:hypothetical protein